MLRLATLPLLLFLFLPVPASAQMRFSDTELGFSMTLPEGFLREADEPFPQPRRIACFVAPGRDAATGWVRLCAERLDGTLPREPLSANDLPPQAKPVKFTWKGFGLQGVRSEPEQASQPTTVFVALVPLRRTGIRLVASAPRAEAANAQAALVATLASLEGETNWLSSTERGERAGETVGQIGVVLIAVGAGMWIMKRRMKRA